MLRSCHYFVTLAILPLLAGTSAAQVCDSTPALNAVRILGTDVSGALTDQTLPYVAGEQSFFQPLDNGWVFALVKAEEGWTLRLYEHARIGDAVDLTAMTPPFGGTPNPRDIFGWHFRNAANTGTNTGDVNAPQHLRAFVVSPALAGTGGYRPSTNPDEPRLLEPGPDDGIGWLRVVDFGLAGLETGQRARMNYLQFEACITWPKSADVQAAQANAASSVYTAVDHEVFGSCGLDLDAYELNAAYLPRKRGGDIDGDDAIDEVAQIVRRSDRRRGFALCRAGTWHQVIGFEVPLGPDIRPEYAGQVEAWQWLAPQDELPPHLGGIELPGADGDRLILERIEKEAVAIYWKDGELRGAHLYHYVEP
jgi:hypothetical protein